MSDKEFGIDTILSMTTGILMCDFGDMHLASEWVLGHSIWTHEFAMPELWDSIKKSVFDQHPDLKDIDAKHVGKDNWKQFADQMKEKYGSTRILMKGTNERTVSPLETAAMLMPGKPIIPPTMSVERVGEHFEKRTPIIEGGMSLRDYFAAAALTGLCHPDHIESVKEVYKENPVGETFKHLARCAYNFADAMLTERAK